MLKAENVMVTLLDIEAIKKAIEKLLPLKAGDEYQVDDEALFDNVLINQDCIYYYMCPTLADGKIQNVWHVPVRTKKKVKGGYRLSLNVEFYYSITEQQLKKYSKKRVSLKEVMGSRYKYNPRIITNTRDFLTAVENLS